MSFLPAFEYLVGLGVFGFCGWLLNGLKATLVDTHIYKDGVAFTFLQYIWAGMFIVYLIFGAWWLIRQYTEDKYIGGGL